MITDVNEKEVKKAGEDIIDDVKKIYDSLECIRELINNSSSYYKSEAGDLLRQKFNKSADNFGSFRDYLERYGEFLKTYSGNVVKYETTEKENISAIADLPD